MKIDTVLFDLDGTLLDTAPDLAQAINSLRRLRSLPDLALSDIRPHAGHGSKTLLKLAFGVDETNPDYKALQEAFLAKYQSCLADATALFPKMDIVLKYLEQKNILWGIVTNKPARFTTEILKALDLSSRAACVVSGDTLPERKPDPAPIKYACELLKHKPERALYVGDTITDVIAGKAAGTTSLVALYGYIREDENPYEWAADGYIHDPEDLLQWI